MAEFDNNMSGALFRNNYKKQPNQPDHTGNCEIDGKTYRIAAWIKDSKAGNKFFSLAFTLEEEAKPAPIRDIDLDQDIPF
jgi:hypothetical protein